MTRRERLRVWADGLDYELSKDLLIECIDELIDSESISFWKDSKYPIWSGNGERLDGLETEEED